MQSESQNSVRTLHNCNFNKTTYSHLGTAKALQALSKRQKVYVFLLPETSRTLKIKIKAARNKLCRILSFSTVPQNGNENVLFIGLTLIKIKQVLGSLNEKLKSATIAIGSMKNA